MSVRVRRIYDPPEPDDGLRVLVDRLWPRGVTKEAAHLDEWPKGLTPSAKLRTWFHSGGSYEGFRALTRRSRPPPRPPNCSTACGSRSARAR